MLDKCQGLMAVTRCFLPAMVKANQGPYYQHGDQPQERSSAGHLLLSHQGRQLRLFRWTARIDTHRNGYQGTSPFSLELSKQIFLRYVSRWHRACCKSSIRELRPCKHKIRRHCGPREFSQPRRAVLQIWLLWPINRRQVWFIKMWVFSKSYKICNFFDSLWIDK